MGIAVNLNTANNIPNIHDLNFLVQKQPPGMFYKKGVLKNFAKFT